MSTKQTFTYKVVGDCAIKADVYGITGGAMRPAVIFIHGGALIGGSRSGFPVIVDTLTNAGYTVVSIDYRLAPETKLKEIIEDIRDAFKWVREKGQALFNIDPDRIGVVGNSAGGYLALMSGFLVEPRPKAVISMYGYGDIDGTWYTRPDPFYCQQPLVEESTARAAVGIRAISEVSQPNNRRFFYLYCRQQGLWPREVTGLDPEVQRLAFDSFCPIRNVTAQYPPTMLVHGDKDTDVPYEQSVAMAKKLEEAGVESQLVTVSGKGHCFEESGFADPVVGDALKKIVTFLGKHLLRSSDDPKAYKGMTAKQLVDAYDVYLVIPDAEELLRANRERAQQVEAHLKPIKDVAYGGESVQKLDIYAPKAAKSVPVIVDIHGGGWASGTKNPSALQASAVMSAGAIWVPIDYGLAPAYSIDQIIDHVRVAISWIYRNIDQYGGDPNQIYIYGFSAGAHLAGTALMPGWHQEYGVPENVIKGAVMLSGVYDLEGYVHAQKGPQEYLKMTLEDARRASPVHHIPKRPIPIIVGYGGDELPQFFVETQVYAGALAKAGCDVILIEVPGTHHFTVINELGNMQGELFQTVKNLLNR